MKLSSERSTTLCQLLADHTVVLPGAINALSAKLIERMEFEAVYLSGAVLSNSVGGVTDTGLMTLSDSLEHCRRVAAACSLPIIADADTGYGGPENAAHTVRTLEAAGVSGVHIEDQDWPKRCGHLDGKRLISTEDMCEKIAAAAGAASSPDFLLLARTDARGVEGYDETVERAHRYLKAGAGGIFPEALKDREEFSRFAKDVPTILLANMTEFGKTPYTTVEEFADMGYRLVIFPVTLQRAAMKAMEECLNTLRTEGTQRSFVDRMQTRQELYDLLDYEVDASRSTRPPSGEQP